MSQPFRDYSITASWGITRSAHGGLWAKRILRNSYFLPRERQRPKRFIKKARSPMCYSRTLVLRKEINPMHYSASITKRKRRKKTEHIARLQYYDKTTGARRETTRSASTPAEAKRILKRLEAEYLSGGSDLLDAHHMTFASLA